MQIEDTEIPDVKLIRSPVFEDARGFFLETWNERKFSQSGLDVAFVQDNFSRSRRGTLRGLHYQIRQAQGKLVRAVSGEVFDVAVDLRRSSRYFGQWVGAVLSDDNHDMLWVPPGFAHGFVVLSEQADIFYKCTDFYAPEHERTISWKDPELAITWPITDTAELALSDKDANGDAFRDAELYP